MLETGIIVALAVIAFGFAYLSTTMAKKHGPLQIAFLVLFVIISTVDIYIMFSFLQTSEPAYGILVNLGVAMMWIIVLVVAYIMIYMFAKAFELFGFGEE